MSAYSMRQLLADYGDEWDINYAPIGGGQHVLRAVDRANPLAVVCADTAADVRDAIEARRTSA